MRRIYSLVVLLWLSLGHAQAASLDGFTVDTFPINSNVTDTNPLPLDVAIDLQTGNTIYMIAEFDRRLYSVSRTATADTVLTTTEIPAPGAPLFRSNLGGADSPSALTFAHERILATPDGSVWIAQGGNNAYNGTKNNWSRIMRRRSDGGWEAYTLPVNSAAAAGLWVSNIGARILWATASSANTLYMTQLRWWHEGETSPTRHPPIDNRWQVLKNFGARNKFPAQLVRLRDGRLAGTLYYASAFFILNLETDEYQEIALATPPPGTIFGSSGPWQIRQYPTDGRLWIVEDYAKRVTVYDVNSGVQTVHDLSSGLEEAEGPHSIAFKGTDAYVTTYTTDANGDARLVKITNSGTVTYGTSFATIGLPGGLTGIEVDNQGTLWVALFQQKKLARLTPQ